MTSRVPSGEIMRIFTHTGEYKDLIQSVSTFDNPVDRTSRLYHYVHSFFVYVSSEIPDVRSNYTGREFELHSKDAKLIFGEVLAQKMYVVMNKISNTMTCKYIVQSLLNT